MIEKGFNTGEFAVRFIIKKIDTSYINTEPLSRNT